MQKQFKGWLAWLLLCGMVCAALTPALASSASQVSVQAVPLVNQSSPTNGMVRVYLSSLGSVSQVDVTVKGTYSLSVTGEYLQNGSAVHVEMDQGTGAISLTCNGQKYNMGQTVSLRRHSSAGGSGVYIRQARESGNLYPGDLSFHAVAGGGRYNLYVIAHIYIENYLYGVLPYEMGNSTNVEALKAQAVAARTYTVRMMQNRASGLYDVKDTTSDQVYRGTPSGNANCVAAVDATKGIVLMYGGSYITTYYSASNGGQTETSRSGSQYAYMQVKDDPFDYANPNSTVKRKTIQSDLTSTANPSGLIALLKTRAISQLNQSGYNTGSSNTVLQTLRSVTPHTPKYAAPSRLYTKMDFTMDVRTQNAYGQSATATVTVTCGIFTELESLLSMSIQSSQNELWTVSQSNGSFVLEARRYGHGMGMSQRGAMQMAKLGYTYDQILGFYYDGCKRVKHSFTNTILSADSDEVQITVEDPADTGEDDSACRASVSLPGAGKVLAIRSAKSETAGLIGTAGNGAMVQVLYSDGAWCQIRFGSLVGYVPAASLKISGTPPQTETAVTTIAGFVTVTANDFVNLRADASMSAKVVGTAPAGAVLPALSVSGSWAKVQYNALTAYANTGFLSAVSAAYPSGNVTDGGQTAFVRGDATNVALLASASTDGQILAWLTGGDSVTLLSDDGSWSRVSYQGQTGYIRSDYLTASLSPSQTTEPTPTPSTPAQGTKLAIVTTQSGSLNMRTLPQAGSSIVTTIPRTAQVEVTQQGDTWCGVTYNGYTGYVMTRYLTLLGQDDPAPSPTPGLSASTAKVTTPSGTLNLRAQPRSGSEILLRIQPGETVAVYERGDEWCHVRYLETDGYVMSMFLTFQQEAESPVPSESPALTDSTRPDATPEPAETPVPTETPAPTGSLLYATVTTSGGSLNLRAQPVTGGQVLTSIPRGITLQVEEKLADWSRVTYHGYTGYVMNRYLRFETASAAPEETTAPSLGQTARVNTPSGSLNLRAEPYAAAQLLCQIPPYETVRLLQYGDSWSCVSYRDYTGYVMTRYLSVEQQDASTPAQPTATPTPASGQTAYVNTASGSLNLRQAPSSSARVITAIPRGTAIVVTAYDAAWAQTTYQGYTGYVMTRFLSYAAPAEPEPGGDTEPGGDSGDPDEEEAVDAWVKTGGGDLNLRQTEASDGAVLDSISNGARVKLLEEGNTWSLILYNGKRGYVMTRYLTVRQPGEEQPDPTASLDDVLDPSLRVPDAPVQAVVISQTEMRLWPMCRQEGSPLGSIAPGETVQVLMMGDTWCCVQTQTLQGYCLTNQLQMVE